MSWVPNNMEGDWHADREYIFCHTVATTKGVAQKLCEGAQVESSEEPQEKKGEKAKGRRKSKVKPLAASRKVGQDREHEKDKDPDKDPEKDKVRVLISALCCCCHVPCQSAIMFLC